MDSNLEGRLKRFISVVILLHGTGVRCSVPLKTFRTVSLAGKIMKNMESMYPTREVPKGKAQMMGKAFVVALISVISKTEFFTVYLFICD